MGKTIEIVVEAAKPAVTKFTLKLPPELACEPTHVVELPYNFKVHVFTETRSERPFFHLTDRIAPVPYSVTEHRCQLIRPDGSSFNAGETYRKLSEVKEYIIERTRRVLDPQRREEYLQ